MATSASGAAAADSSDRLRRHPRKATVPASAARKQSVAMRAAAMPPMVTGTPSSRYGSRTSWVSTMNSGPCSRTWTKDASSREESASHTTEPAVARNGRPMATPRKKAARPLGGDHGRSRAARRERGRAPSRASTARRRPAATSVHPIVARAPTPSPPSPQRARPPAASSRPAPHRRAQPAARPAPATERGGSGGRSTGRSSASGAGGGASCTCMAGPFGERGRSRYRRTCSEPGTWRPPPSPGSRVLPG
ncbi:MAG: hypothetical protein K0R11_1987 [Acidimicrobiales bacterium]|nr:hypothetical protein [Acidimicrobiales bacterium]